MVHAVSLIQEKRTAVAAALAAARENALLKERVAFLEAARQADIPDDASVGYTPSTCGGRTPFGVLSFTPEAATLQRAGPLPRYRFNVGGDTPAAAGGAASFLSPEERKRLGPAGAGPIGAKESVLRAARKPFTPVSNIGEHA